MAMVSIREMCVATPFLMAGSFNYHVWQDLPVLAVETASGVAMSARTNKRRIYAMFDSRFNGNPFWRSAEEQAWLDVAPVGREFGSPDFERLQILDLYVAGQMSSDKAMLKLGLEGLEDLRQLVLAANLIVPQAGARLGDP